MAGVVLVVGGVLGLVWRSVEQIRLPAIAAPSAPVDSAGTTEPSRSAAAGATATAPRARRAAPRPVKVDAPREQPTRKRSDAPEAPGYVAQPPDSGMSPDAAPPTGASTSTPVRPRPAPVRSPKPRGRPLGELEQSPALRLAIGDITRVGLAENVAEAQPGLLIVNLAPNGMDVPSSTYNLQRLYLAYSAATTHPDTVTLQLRRGGRVYGWFTRGGMIYASPGGVQP